MRQWFPTNHLKLCSRGIWQYVVLPMHTTMLIGSMSGAMDPLGARFAVGIAIKLRGVTYTVTHSLSKGGFSW